MKTFQYTEDEYDMLKEIFNIAMGQAGASLATLLNSFVELSVPDIKIIDVENILDTIFQYSVFPEDETIVSFRQGFSNQVIEGDALVVFNDKTRSNISSILGLPDKMDAGRELEFMQELSNILVGACLNNISEQLFSQNMSFKKPQLMAEGVSLRKMVYSSFMPTSLKWRYTLLARISLSLRDKLFKSDMIVFLSEQGIEVVRNAIQELISED